MADSSSDSRSTFVNTENVSGPDLCMLPDELSKHHAAWQLNLLEVYSD